MFICSISDTDDYKIKLLFWMLHQWSEKNKMFAWCTGHRDFCFLYFPTFRLHFLLTVKSKNSRFFTECAVIVVNCCATAANQNTYNYISCTPWSNVMHGTNCISLMKFLCCGSYLQRIEGILCQLWCYIQNRWNFCHWWPCDVSLHISFRMRCTVQSDSEAQ